MNIVLGEANIKGLREKYIVLSLDTFAIPGISQPVRSFCVLEDLSIDQLTQVEQWQQLHENLIVNYGRRNWSFCEQAIGHLMGRWNGQLDSFYSDVADRVGNLKNLDLPGNWSPIIQRQDGQTV